jgi:hypothetical protein
MIAHVIGSFCAGSVWMRERTVTIKTFFGSALDTGSAADHASKLSGSPRLRPLAQHS